MSLKVKQTFGGIALMLVLLSCNLPFSTQPEPQPPAPAPVEIATPTPEDTATSIYPPTFPPPAIVFTPTAEPPTETFTPTVTNTLELPSPTATNTLVPYNPNASPTPPPTIPSGYYTATPGTNNTSTPSGPAPTARPSFSVTAIRFTPTIDGDWSEWPYAETSAGYVVFGGGNWINSNDLNASFKAAYDANNLYIAVRVLDDVYAQNATGYKLYLGDSLEILLDTNVVGDYYYRGISSDDFQLGISPGKGSISGAKEAYLWYPANLRGARTSVVVATTGYSDGYLIEASIPWSIFKVTPVSGTHYGFAFSVSDNDNLTENLQESMVSSVSGRRFLNPTTWGDLTLQ